MNATAWLILGTSLLLLEARLPAQPAVPAAANAPRQEAAPVAAEEKPLTNTFTAADGKYHFTLDATAAPDLMEWAERELRPVVAAWYPKIVELLPSEGFSAPTNVTLRFRNDMRGTPASAGGGRVNMNSEWFRRELKREARGAVVHELVHVVQSYGRARRSNPDAPRTPGWLVEGIPDYIRWFLYEPETKGAEITERNLSRARYDASYRVTGNFLNWVVQTYDRDLIRKLNAAARAGAYTEQLWQEYTGKPLQALGDEWKQAHEKRLAGRRADSAAHSWPRWKRPVMTWVPPYAIAQSKARLLESFGGAGMKDALTHLGLQFWLPTQDGGLTRAGKTNETTDAAIREFRDWGRTNGVRVLLCVYNHVKSWNWELARAAFAEHPDQFVEALLAELNRLQLDGVDIDLEGNGSHDADQAAFVGFIRKLSARLHAEGRHLTVDTFAYTWNAPNQTWWPELLPHVDALTSMGYAELGAHAPKWRGYPSQQAAVGNHASKLMIGLPSNRNEWRGNTLMEHLRWLKTNGRVGVAFWDAQLRADGWRTPEVWTTLREIRGEPAPASPPSPPSKSGPG